MAIEVGDIIRVAMQWFVDGSNMQVNNHTFEVTDLGAVTSDADFMTDLAEVALLDWYTIILGAIADNVVGSLLTGMNLTKGEVLPPTALPIDGTGSATDSLPLQTTALVYWNGAEARRQARTYLPVFIETANLDGGTWESGLITALGNFGLAGLDPIAGDEIAVEKRIGVLPFTGVLVPTFAGVSTAPRTQRRRTLGRGA